MSENKQEAINKILALDEGAQGELMVLINTGMGMFKDESQLGDDEAAVAPADEQSQSNVHDASADASSSLDVSASAAAPVAASSSLTPSTSASSASTARLRQLEAEHAELQKQVRTKGGAIRSRVFVESSSVFRIIPCFWNNLLCLE